ncbi:MAG: hypothetical protein H7Y38_03125 [Armatimonadetes bacterium]|nr:hypothetical protein [Armatimonadota bacterium]
MKGDDAKKTRTTLPAHRRVGLISLAFVVVGAGWLSSVVLPALQKNDRENGVVAGAFGIPLGLGAKEKKMVTLDRATSKAVVDTSETSPQNLVEARFVSAPTGAALQLLIGITRSGTDVAPTVTGTITFSTNGKPQEFWRLLPRVVGAAPAPGVQIAQRWDRYVILPRDMVFRRDEERIYAPTPPPEPVPADAPHTLYRMAGYVELAAEKGGTPIRVALMETRIPGIAPVWRTVRTGDLMQRKSPQEIAAETRAEANIDVAPVVQTIEPDAIILRGGGNKTLRVPMSATGVADTFDQTIAAKDAANTTADTRKMEP